MSVRKSQPVFVMWDSPNSANSGPGGEKLRSAKHGPGGVLTLRRDAGIARQGPASPCMSPTGQTGADHMVGRAGRQAGSQSVSAQGKQRVTNPGSFKPTTELCGAGYVRD